MFHSQHYLVVTIIHIQSLRCQVYIYVYIYILLNIETLFEQKKKKILAQKWIPRAKKIFPFAILGTRAMGSPDLV